MDLRDPGLAKSPRIGAVGTIRFFRNFRSAMGHSSVRVEHLMRIQLRMSEAGREKLRKALEEIETYRWVTFASQNAIEMFFGKRTGSDSTGAGSPIFSSPVWGKPRRNS